MKKPEGHFYVPFRLKNCRTESVLSAGDIGEKADSGICLDRVIGAAVRSGGRGHPDFFGIEADRHRNTPARILPIQLYRSYAGLAGKKLTKDFDV